MKAALSVGLSPTDLLAFEEYEDIGELLKYSAELEKKKELRFKLNVASAVQIAFVGANSKRGLEHYNSWISKLVDDINGVVDTTPTVFEQIKASVRSKLTLAERIGLKRRN